MRRKNSSKGKCRRKEKDVVKRGKLRKSEKSKRGVTVKKSSRWSWRGARKPRKEPKRHISCTCANNRSSVANRSKIGKGELSLWSEEVLT